MNPVITHIWQIKSASDCSDTFIQSVLWVREQSREPEASGPVFVPGSVLPFGMT